MREKSLKEWRSGQLAQNLALDQSHEDRIENEASLTVLEKEVTKCSKKKKKKPKQALGGRHWELEIPY